MQSSKKRQNTAEICISRKLTGKGRHGNVSRLFTVAAVDNLDHNPSSTTSKDSFHGTSISLMQLPTLECPGQDRGRIVINHASSTREIGPLPEEYTSVLPASLKKQQQFTVPAVESSVKLTDSDTFTKAQ